MVNSSDWTQERGYGRAEALERSQEAVQSVTAYRRLADDSVVIVADPQNKQSYILFCFGQIQESHSNANRSEVTVHGNTELLMLNP